MHIIPNEPATVRLMLSRQDYLEKVTIDAYEEVSDDEKIDNDSSSIITLN
jgi:hypothetical protein